MTESRIQIEQVKVGELMEFINRPGVMQGKTVPISRLRAMALVANPCAVADDLALLVAMCDGECVGYVGYIRGLIRIDDQIHKIYWGMTWYGAPTPAGAAVGGVLLHTSLRLELDVANTNMAQKTLPIYRRLKFKPVGPLRYFELNFDTLDPLGFPWRVVQVLLRRKGRRSTANDAVFQWNRRISKRVAYRTARTTISRVAGDFDFAEIPELPLDARSDEERNAVEFIRTPELVRWTLQYPWITDQIASSTPRYEFSDLSEMVRFVVLEVRSRDTAELHGHIVLSICRDHGITTVKALDHFLHDCDRYSALLAAGLKYAKKFHADRLHVPNGCGERIAMFALLRLAFRRRQREYFCLPRRRSSVLGPVLDRIALQYCDGDSPFT